ncbi:MAG: hydantoinase B/oxoprolinase family protein [Solirubrobacterales bacterium]
MPADPGSGAPSTGAEAVNPITLRVIGGSLSSIAREMAEVLYRMAYSNIIRESEDLGAGIFDIDGRELCESESTPMHIGSIPGYIRGVNRRLAGTYQPGDVILHNHPYHGASHSPDYCVLMPVFAEAEHIGFSACTGHVLDIGGAYPGVSLDVVDVWAEGKLFDGMKLYAGGVRNDDLFQHMLDNVRTPGPNAGDVEAMIASCRLGVRRYEALVRKYGLATVRDAITHWMNYSERRLRQQIEALPDGTYRAPSGFLDDDGKRVGVPLPIELAVTVSGSDVTVDLTGSAEQVESAFNVPFEGSVIPTVNFAIRTLFLDEDTTAQYVPQNEGIFRPIHAVAPLGSIFNPRFPASCFMRFPQINRIPDLVNLALAELLPDKVVAGCSAAIHSVVYSGLLEGGEEYWVYIEVGEGSYGGRPGKDGMDSVDCLMANTRNNPIEEIELRHPLVCERYELRDDPPAAGQWRGGIGSVRRWRLLEPTFMATEGDQRSDPPKGLFGGHDGLPGSLRRWHGGAECEPQPSKVTNVRWAAGDVVELTLPSGGGYGPPRARAPEAVLADVRDDLYTVAQARDLFGVAIDPQTMRVDAAATSALRGEEG